MRPILCVRSRRSLGLVLTIVLLSLLGTASAADPVEDLQRILFEGTAIQNKEQMATFQKKLEERSKAIQRPGDLRRALLLGELREEVIAQQPGTPTG